MDKKVKILVTSIGSLVGQNIEDVLESPLFRRREDVELIGTNSIPDSPNNYRCDRCYLVSKTRSEEFVEEMKAIIREEAPDLILSGRDADTLRITRIMEQNPDLPGKLAYGKASTLNLSLNKLESWEFCKRHDLPFASTYVIGKSGTKEGLKDFIETHGYPIIAKPIQGFASKGVSFVRSWEDVETISGCENFMFQEYLGDPSRLTSYFQMLDQVTPLFAHAPDTIDHSCQTVIAPDGSFSPIFISRLVHSSGATVGFSKVEDEELEATMTRFVKAMIEEGGRGPFGIQFRKDQQGKWKAQEMNMRTNGNTFSRFICGQDELGLIIRAVLPDFDFPLYEAPEEAKQYTISKKLYCQVIVPDKMADLAQHKKWSV